MFKYFSTFLLLIVLPSLLFSQNIERQLKIISDSVDSFVKRKKETIVYDSSKGRYFSYDAYNRFFDRYFTLVNYEKETFTDGNSAALQLSENDTRLNLTLSKKEHNSILTFGTQLSVTDKSGTIFSGKKPTSGTQFFINHSVLLTKQRSLNFDDDFMESNYRNRRFVWDSLYDKYVLDNPMILPVLVSKIKKADLKVDSLKQRLQQLEALNKNIDSKISESVIECKAQLVEAVAEKGKLSNQLQSLGITKPLSIMIKDIKKGAEDAGIQKELSAQGVNVFTMHWLSTGLSYKRENYATYDSTLDFSKRIAEKAFDRWEFKSAYNVFWQRTDQWIERNRYKGFNSLFGSVSYSIGNNNNFSTVSESNLNIIKTVSSNDTTYQFSTSQKLRDVTGKLFKRSWLHKIGMQGTGMLGKKQFGGINVIANSEFTNKQEPIFNVRLGGLFRFIDSYDEKSKVNFEIFIAFNDLTDVVGEGKSVWQRKQIGIAATVPFGKVFFR